MSVRSYSEMIHFHTFEERYRYLQLSGKVGNSTFGFDRYLNQQLYRSEKWRSIRDRVILRDNGCDLGIEDREIHSRILIHHMNPITQKVLEGMDSLVFDPEFLICVSHETHNAIHYGDEHLLVKDPIIRKPNDMCPWRL